MFFLYYLIYAMEIQNNISETTSPQKKVNGEIIHATAVNSVRNLSDQILKL